MIISKFFKKFTIRIKNLQINYRYDYFNINNF